MMTASCVAVLLSVLAVGAAAQGGPAGRWRAIVIPGQPLERQPKMFGTVLLDLKAEGGQLTGTARMGDGWPGIAPIADGTIDGSRFSFTWTGTIASTGGVPLRSRVPQLTFTGTVDGDQMTLSMDGDYRMEMQGERLPPQ